MNDLPSTSMYRYRETGNVAKWVAMGYVYIHCDVRGSGKSEGTYDVWGPKEQMDYYDMIEWAGTQAWSNGRVGMFGESYYGMNQWQAAQHNPPHLACIAPYDAGASYIHWAEKNPWRAEAARLGVEAVDENMLPRGKFLFFEDGQPAERGRSSMGTTDHVSR